MCIRDRNGNTYEYTDTSWKDKLTKINGDNITYDANGNPLSYRDGIDVYKRQVMDDWRW